MSKSQYPYPPDEFDVRGPEGAPVGVHREPRSGWSSVWPFLLVAVVFGGLALGVMTYLSDSDPSTENPPTAAEQSASPDASADEGGDDGSGEGSGDAEGSGEGDGSGETEGSGDGESTEEPSEEPSEEATDVAALLEAADTSAYVRVLNDGGPSGEAGRGSDALGAQGFTNAVADNYPTDDSGQTTNVVWYTEGRAETAAAVAAVLGVPAEETSEQALSDGDVIVVIKQELDIAE